MEYIKAFVVGGLICMLVQIMVEKTKMMPGRIMVLLVVSGSVLGFLGVYEPFAEWAGAGATVPLLGFGNTLWKRRCEGDERGWCLGVFKGGLRRVRSDQRGAGVWVSGGDRVSAGDEGIGGYAAGRLRARTLGGFRNQAVRARSLPAAVYWHGWAVFALEGQKGADVWNVGR